MEVVEVEVGAEEEVAVVEAEAEEVVGEEVSILI